MSAEPFRPKARRPRGFEDRRGPSLAAERAIVEKVLAVYQRWGFERLETSAFEYADALGKFLPDQDRPNEGVFALEDDDSQWMALRYDLTAPLARFVAENFDALPKPYRRCAAGPVWRNEKPGPGRFREFWQCDADTVGAASPAADAEMIAMACEALEAVGLKQGEFLLKVSDRRVLDAIIELSVRREIGYELQGWQKLHILRAVDKLDRLGEEGVRALLLDGRTDDSGDFTRGANLPPIIANSILDALVNPGSAKGGGVENQQRLDFLRHNLNGSTIGQQVTRDLQELHDRLNSLGVPRARWNIDTAVVRGLEYYTGAVFEAELFVNREGEDGGAVRLGSVGGGGRYDDLVSRFKGQPIPATGFSIGVSRLATALSAAGRLANAAPGPVVVLVMDQAEIGESLALAAELRAAGIAAEAYLGGAGMKAQLKYADKRSAPVAVIVGSEERARGVVSLKNLKLGEALSKTLGDDRAAWEAARARTQREVPRTDLVAAVQTMIAEGNAP